MNLKVFAYHSFNNGSGWYRILQPYDTLAQLGGFDVDRLPDDVANIVVPIEKGESNVPGIRTHTQVQDWAHVIVNQYRGGLKETARMIAQGRKIQDGRLVRFRPVVLDIDDDIVHLDPHNPVFKSLMAGKNLDGKFEEFTVDRMPEMQQRVTAEGGFIGELDGKFYYFVAGLDEIENVIEQARGADLVTVSTPALYHLYRQVNRNVVVVPNGIRLDLWPKPRRYDDGKVRMGLFGSNSHVGDWRELAPVIKELLDEHPELVLCCNTWYLDQTKGQAWRSEMERDLAYYTPDYFEELVDHPQVEWAQPCPIAEWPAWMSERGVDIGLAPLAHTTFNKSRSNLRFLEFGALGLPGVYENYDPFNAAVDHGRTGYLAKNPVEWKKYVKRLIDNPLLCATMGAAARAEVAEKFDQFKISAQLGQVLNKLHARFMKETYLTDLGRVATPDLVEA